MVKAFYQNVNYEPVRDRTVKRTPPKPSVKISERHPRIRARLLDYFQEASFERMGVLHGEYLVHPAGILLVDREGLVTAACVSLENPFISQWLNDGAAQFEAEPFRNLMQYWDGIAYGVNYAMLADAYEANYFHFSLEMTPRVRFFPSLRYNPFVTTKGAVAKPFQLDLLQRCVSSRACHVLESFVRIRDPLISHDQMSEEGIDWLRGASQISAPTGSRRIYVKRSQRGTRTADGGGVSETPEFMEALSDFGFEVVEFGNGERGVAEQVELLSGAGIIIAAHGAAVTNLAYLQEPVTFIEIMGARTVNACFLHLASMLDFNYYALTSSDYDEESNIVVDADELRQTLRAYV
jgi:hypothetical protein